MSDKIEFATFPCNEYEALAMLYVQNQNLSSKSPSDIFYMYEEAKQEIRNAKRTYRKEHISNN